MEGGGGGRRENVVFGVGSNSDETSGKGACLTLKQVMAAK